MKEKWYKRLWVWGVVLLVLFATTGMITAPYWINCINLCTSLSQGDLLAYFGAVLGFIGTVFLGILALWQNHRLHQINARILENEHRYGSIPQFEVSGVSVEYRDAFLPKESPVFVDNNGVWQAEITTHYPEDNDCEILLVVDLKNIGDGLAKRLKAVYLDPDMKPLPREKIKKKDVGAYVESQSIRSFTQTNQTAHFKFRLPLLMGEHDSDRNSITLEYSNLYDYKYVNFLYISYAHTEGYRFKVSVDIQNLNDI